MTEPLPAWSVAVADSRPRELPWPAGVSRQWAWGGSDGSGVRVCLVDSGVDASHPQVGRVEQRVAAALAEDGTTVVVPDEAGDVSGHGTACAGIIHSVAPACTLASVRVLGADLTGAGEALIAGVRWAVEQRFDIVSLSLSTRKRVFAEALRDLTDDAWFQRSLLVASAHNLAIESYPWRFPSVISVGSHDSPDPFEFHVNDHPPVDLFARGVDVEVPWLDGGTIVATGNSFAAPHVTGIAALILAAHPQLLPYEVKAILASTANNVTLEP
jgi:subtilisin